MAQEDGRIAVVTGGTRGIGYAIVRSLARYAMLGLPDLLGNAWASHVRRSIRSSTTHASAGHLLTGWQWLYTRKGTSTACAGADYYAQSLCVCVCWEESVYCRELSIICRSGYKGFVLGYNSDHEAAKRAQAELAEEFGVRSVCVQVQS